MGQFNLVVLPGDGIGPEVAAEGIKVLQAIGNKFGHSFNLQYELLGGASIDATGEALTQDTLKKCQNSDAVLMGAVGGPKWDAPQAKVHPEDGILALRRGLGVFANLRPVKMYPMLVNSTNLKPEVVNGVDLIFARELTGGIYYAQPKKQWKAPEGRMATDSMTYSEQEIERIVRVGFELARSGICG